MSAGTMNLTLRVWRQKDAASEGRFETYQAKNISADQSFLEMLDMVNEDLTEAGKDPIAFDHDCREGICGMCALVINGRAHGPDGGKTTCSLHMRRYKDGDTITVEPFRARAFPVIRDLVTDRGAFDRIIAAGGYTSVKTGSACEANSIPVPQENAEMAMDAAACIGCGACVAACPNASAMLFMGAKVSQFALLPQGQPERTRRVLRMVEQHDSEGFGNCTNEYECMKACPKEINVSNIARLNREYLRATVVARD
ncbi:MAG: succinate dehydrogenase/fumarate reductase iron-sulfur subunit [Elusimicrobia bacterium CG_4_9_14_3_um_filter_62_55]|nr:MAG: succinate dehydrogenase/fumarate reductase iron-sulfur subunit [Elusimicrobia bacterium CG22_combo_CG10-13_8_21_14_all_63_91]PJA16902.1 MAG: succinate dehydrogenase/fumarate reductase iron-sulfur subunit [Elusimicrobia bacterium CG_4_10_14_0_2_um_filter_63_34]PJB24906.1 MAG: succinate dehydrogenase/fumarate reductase iron-sulfur subunit [Elusimicrobia bacterium CG_4_9_14_3_um_filter_62_55]